MERIVEIKNKDFISKKIIAETSLQSCLKT